MWGTGRLAQPLWLICYVAISFVFLFDVAFSCTHSDGAATQLTRMSINEAKAPVIAIVSAEISSEVWIAIEHLVNAGWLFDAQSVTECALQVLEVDTLAAAQRVR